MKNRQGRLRNVLGVGQGENLATLCRGWPRVNLVINNLVLTNFAVN